VFHVVSKLISFLIQPSNLALIVIAAGFIIEPHRRRAGQWLIAAGFGWIVLAGFLPIGSAAILPLEDRFASHELRLPEGDIAGIIILGGFEDGQITVERGGLALNDAAERLTEGLRAARSLPNAKLIFTGGNGSLFDGEDAGTAVRDYLVDAGIASSRITIETASRDTYENALFTRDLIHPKPDERWLLVTSAFHMPRAVGVFRALGFNVVPYPVDFRTRGAANFLRLNGSFAAGLQLTDLAVKEWLGLAVYRLMGPSAELFPGP
jgi:uncharacterized SAM-binding protein YcdF (DUF218 family)